MREGLIDSRPLAPPDLAPDEIVAEDCCSGSRPNVGYRDMTLRPSAVVLANRCPQRQVSKGKVSEKLPLRYQFRKVRDLGVGEAR